MFFLTSGLNYGSSRNFIGIAKKVGGNKRANFVIRKLDN